MYFISFYPYIYHPMSETLRSSLFAEEETGSEPVRSQDESPDALTPQPVPGMPQKAIRSPGSILLAELRLPPGSLTSRNPEGRAGNTRAV